MTYTSSTSRPGARALKVFLCLRSSCMRCRAPNFFETAMSSSYMSSCSKIWDKVVKAIAEPSGLSSFVFSKIYPLYCFVFGEQLERDKE